MHANKPQGFLEIEQASHMPLEAADWGPFTTGFLKMHPVMVPAIQDAIKAAEWRRSPNPVGSIKTAAYRAATRMGIQTLGPIEDAYPVFQQQAKHLSRSGLPKAVTADDLAQEAAITYLFGGARGGKDKSKKDVKRTMTDFIRKEQRGHGTAKTPGEKATGAQRKRSTVSTSRWALNPAAPLVWQARHIGRTT